MITSFNFRGTVGTLMIGMCDAVSYSDKIKVGYFMSTKMNSILDVFYTNESNLVIDGVIIDKKKHKDIYDYVINYINRVLKDPHYKHKEKVSKIIG